MTYICPIYNATKICSPAVAAHWVVEVYKMGFLTMYSAPTFPYHDSLISVYMNQSPSDRGLALLTGTIILENGRILDPNKPRLLTYDWHIYLPAKFGSPPDELLAVVRYWDRNNEFEAMDSWPDTGPCSIHSTVCKHPFDALPPKLNDYIRSLHCHLTLLDLRPKEFLSRSMTASVMH